MKKILCICLLLLFTLAGCEGEIFIPAGTVEPTSALEPTEELTLEKTVVLENENLLFSLDAETTQFTITVKETGMVWYSDAYEDSSVKGVVSTVNLFYADKSMCLDKKIYRGADFIRVDYEVAAREYIIPFVITWEDYEEYMGVLSGGNKAFVSQYYKKLDINNLSESDEEAKDALLERYPSMADGVIYVLRSGVKESFRNKCEQIFAGVDYTYEDYLADKDLDKAEKPCDYPVKVSIMYRLDKNGFSVEVPSESIQGSVTNLITGITILEDFGVKSATEEFFSIKAYDGKIITQRIASGYHEREEVGEIDRTGKSLYFLTNGENSYIRDDVLDETSGYQPCLHIEYDEDGDDVSRYIIRHTYNSNENMQPPVYKQYYTFINSGDVMEIGKAYKQYLESTYPLD